MKNQYNTKFLLVFFVLFLSACQSILVQTENSYLEISSHASIEITQSLEVAPNSARAFLQGGDVIPYARLDLYEVNCEIEINTVSENRQIIEAGVFDIISIAQEESPIVKRKGIKKQIMIASLNYAWASGSPVDIKRYFKFSLAAQDPESKSQVRAVICRGIQDTPYAAELPTYEQMKAASSRYIQFNF